MKTMLATIAMAASIAGAAVAQTSSEGIFAPEPGSDLAQFYEANAERVAELMNQARYGETAARLEALEELGTTYPDAALSVATELVKDDDKAVAVAAARLLADAIVMTDHTMSGQMPVGGAEIMQRSRVIRDALRPALSDENDELRRTASAILASLSDEQALAAIETNARKGIIPEVEAINYFALARPEIVTSYIEPYLDVRGAAQQSAVSYLGALPEYQPTVREEVLLNDGADVSSRVTAAEVLGQYDRDFSSYALAVTSDPVIPAAVYATIMSEYTANAANNISNLTSATLEALEKSVDEYTLRNQDPDVLPQLNDVKQQLQQLRQSYDK
jgi:hypothetical protein